MRGTASPGPATPRAAAFKVRSDVPFFAALLALCGVFVFLILAMLAADADFTSWQHIRDALADPNIRYAIHLSLVSCTITALLSLWVAVPAGYLLARYRFPGKTFLDAILDIPIVLPPLVVGLSLLILFRTRLGSLVESVIPVTHAIPSVILAQFMVACAFAVRTMRVTFDQIDPRREQVALTLGCSRGQAFWLVVLPEAARGIVSAGTLAWARALGEFGPILVFSGTTRGRTEVMPTTIFLEFSIGHVEAAVAVSFLMVAAAVVVLVVTRLFGLKRPVSLE